MRVDDKGNWPKCIGGVELFSQLKTFHSERIVGNWTSNIDNYLRNAFAVVGDLKVSVSMKGTEVCFGQTCSD